MNAMKPEKAVRELTKLRTGPNKAAESGGRCYCRCRCRWNCRGR